MMITPGAKVYKGMIVGEHTRDNDLEINILKGKQPHQTSAPPRRTRRWPDPADPDDAGKALAYIENDELVEVTRSRSAAQEVPRRQRPQARGKGQGSGG